MKKFCPNCGTPITDPAAPTCSNCGIAFSSGSDPAAGKPADSAIIPPAAQTTTPAALPMSKRTTINRQELFNRAIPFFAARQYSVIAQTDYLISFESQNRDINWLIFVILCCFGILLAVVYYYWFTRQHQVTISISGNDQVTFTAIGNTDQAKIDAGEFTASI